ncbi:MAG: histidine phosphatase family protein, partial [Leptolyngbyaceae bacterium]|nr:histidine phosphatase family protein [Leptolyngbyaceae bacterium]
MHISLDLSPNITQIILVRHGRSTYNDQQRYQGTSDAAVLNETGWLQAQLISECLPLKSIDAVYASPLKRVQQTVEGMFSRIHRASSTTEPSSVALNGDSPTRAIGVETATLPTPLGASFHTSLLLQEINLPDWHGLTYAEVKQRYPRDYECWKHWPHNFQQGNTYPVQDLYSRAQMFWKAMLPNHAGQTVLIVAHGGSNHALISTALGLPPCTHHCLQQSNGGISLLEYDHLWQQFQLQTLNATQHLSEALPKLKESKQGVRLLLIPVVEDAKRSDDSEALPTAYRPLSDALLSSLDLDYCVIQDSVSAQSAAKVLLQNHSDLLQTRMPPEHLLMACQMTLTQH